MSTPPLSVSQALRQRRSIRAFRPDPVTEAQVRELLEIARRAPSGGNLQPWKVIVVSGAARDAVVELAKARSGAAPTEEGAYPIYPANLWEPYRSRRYKIGEDMYALLGIPREDKAARLRQVARNYEFFGAPVGIFFVIDQRMGLGQWAHLGMFMLSLALAAEERGLGTCFQEFWGTLRDTLKTHFRLDTHELVYCAMALGYPDTDAVINTLRSERATVDEIAAFLR